MSLELVVHQSRGGRALWPRTRRLDPRYFLGPDFSGTVIGGGLAKPPTQPLLPYIHHRGPQLGCQGATSEHKNIGALQVSEADC
jgi:hypothetical protein